MADEIATDQQAPEPAVTPEEQPGEPQKDTAGAEPEAEKQPEPQPEQKAQPDWEAAYVGLQRSQNRVYGKLNNVLKQNAVLADTVKVLKDGQGAILRNTLGDDQARSFETQTRQAQERNAAMQAAQAAENYIRGTTSVLLDALEEAGVNAQDPNVDWGRDASDVNEWVERVRPSVRAAIRKANEQRVRSAEEGFKAKSAKEVKAEAEALTQRQLKEAGVDRIDSGRGSSPGTFASRIRDMDANSPEFQKLIEDAKSGRLRI